MRKLLATISLGVALVVALPSIAFAHVVVTPDAAITASRTTFSVSVPNEKETAVSGLRLTVPSDLESVSPTVEPGWTITTKTDDKKNVTEISWTGGSIPEGQRDDFTFRAKMPAEPTDLIWKVYQTYADGTVAAWDQKPVEEGSASHAAEASDKGPYSVTAVKHESADTSDNTTTDTAATAETSNIAGLPTAELALGVGLAALILSVLALLKSGHKTKHDDTPDARPAADTDTNTQG